MNHLVKFSTAACAVAAFVAFSMLTSASADAQQRGHKNGNNRGGNSSHRGGNSSHRGGHSNQFRGGHSNQFRGGHSNNFRGGHYGGSGIRIGGTGISIGIGTGFNNFGSFGRGVNLNYYHGIGSNGYSNYRRQVLHNSNYLGYYNPTINRYRNHYGYSPSYYGGQRSGHWHR